MIFWNISGFRSTTYSYLYTCAPLRERRPCLASNPALGPCKPFDLSVAPCRNCGNVFCASCCDQKIPVPSQQLFEPTRVCKTCYSNLQVSSVPRDLELEKPITASSN